MIIYHLEIITHLTQSRLCSNINLLVRTGSAICLFTGLYDDVEEGVSTRTVKVIDLFSS